MTILPGTVDRIALPDFPNPGLDELLASLKSVADDWHTVDLSTLAVYTYRRGHPPSCVGTVADVERLGREATRRNQQSSDFITRMMPGLPLVPVDWLERKAKAIKIKPSFVDRRSEFFGGMAFGAPMDFVWASVISEYNGHLKTIKELHQYALDSISGEPYAISELQKLYGEDGDQKDSERTNVAKTLSSINKMKPTVQNGSADGGRVGKRKFVNLVDDDDDDDGDDDDEENTKRVPERAVYEDEVGGGGGNDCNGGDRDGDGNGDDKIGTKRVKRSRVSANGQITPHKHIALASPTNGTDTTVCLSNDAENKVRNLTRAFDLKDANPLTIATTTLLPAPPNNRSGNKMEPKEDRECDIGATNLGIREEEKKKLSSKKTDVRKETAQTSSKKTDVRKETAQTSSKKTDVRKVTVQTKVELQQLTKDIWQVDGDWVCVTTNGERNKKGEAIMGRGIAYEAATRFPACRRILSSKLASDGNHVFDLGTYNSKTIVSFPTKHEWRQKSDVDLIRQSCVELLTLWRADHEKTGVMKRVLLPRPGCANGGLRYESDVRPILEEHFTGNISVASHFIIICSPPTPHHLLPPTSNRPLSISSLASSSASSSLSSSSLSLSSVSRTQSSREVVTSPRKVVTSPRKVVTSPRKVVTSPSVGAHTSLTPLVFADSTLPLVNPDLVLSVNLVPPPPAAPLHIKPVTKSTVKPNKPTSDKPISTTSSKPRPPDVVLQLLAPLQPAPLQPAVKLSTKLTAVLSAKPDKSAPFATGLIHTATQSKPAITRLTETVSFERAPTSSNNRISLPSSSSSSTTKGSITALTSERSPSLSKLKKIVAVQSTPVVASSAKSSVGVASQTTKSTSSVPKTAALVVTKKNKPNVLDYVWNDTPNCQILGVTYAHTYAREKMGRE
jgi:hypothetical protein